MTAVRSATPPSVSGPVEERTPRRVQVPRWLDLRLLLGLLLVLGSVLVGARVLTAAHATVPVWAAAGDLAAGSVLQASDVVAVDVRLAAAGEAYLPTDVSLRGRMLGRPVHKGELLPRSALEQPRALVQLALPIQAGYVPPSLARGQLVDVYAMAGAASGGNAAQAPVALVVAGVPVQELSARASGVLSTSSATVQVVVSVPEERAAQVLGAIGGRPLAVVVHQSVEGRGAGSSTAPGVPTAPAPSSTAAPTG